jgi:transcriptional regulator with XRE-family HTH domain
MWRANHGVDAMVAPSVHRVVCMRLRPLPDALRAAREAAGLTLATLAESLGFRPEKHGGCSTISRWENGGRTPDLDTLARLAGAFGAPLVFRIDGADVTVTPRKGRES